MHGQNNMKYKVSFKWKTFATYSVCSALQ